MTSRLVAIGLVLWAAAGLPLHLSGRVLARPGWAGSGVAAEAWWRTAVFYRLDPARFQDTDGDGTGDLPGVAERLDYLQGLGVDALLLDGDFDPAGLGQLVRAASEHHLRVVMTVPAALQAEDRQVLLGTVHGWLSAGAAGVFLPKRGGTAEATYASLVTAVGAMVRSFPGERVLLTEPVVADAATTGDLDQRSPAGSAVRGRVGQLTVAAILPTEPPSASALRQSVASLTGRGAGGGGGASLLRFAEDPRTGSPDAVAAAAVLLLSRGAAIFDFGDEIGLQASAANAEATLPVMQWTPANVQQAAAPVARVPAANSGETVYGPYRPYVKPPPARLTGGAPVAPKVSVDGNLPQPLPDPNTLPGFTTGALPNPPVQGAALNVASEDRAPGSVLNAYRQIIALHHGNAALRDGLQTVLNRDAQNAVVWVRRSPAGARTVADVVVAVNLGDNAVTLSLDRDLVASGMRTGALRALFSFAPGPLTGESTGALRLPPHAVFVGEMVRGR